METMSKSNNIALRVQKILWIVISPIKEEKIYYSENILA